MVERENENELQQPPTKRSMTVKYKVRKHKILQRGMFSLKPLSQISQHNFVLCIET